MSKNLRFITTSTYISFYDRKNQCVYPAYYFSDQINLIETGGLYCHFEISFHTDGEIRVFPVHKFDIHKCFKAVVIESV